MHGSHTDKPEIYKISQETEMESSIDRQIIATNKESLSVSQCEAIGESDGIPKGKIKGEVLKEITLAVSKAKKGKNLSAIAADLECTPAYIRPIYEVISGYQDITDPDKLYEILLFNETNIQKWKPLTADDVIHSPERMYTIVTDRGTYQQVQILLKENNAEQEKSLSCNKNHPEHITGVRAIDRARGEVKGCARGEVLGEAMKEIKLAFAKTRKGKTLAEIADDLEYEETQAANVPEGIQMQIDNHPVGAKTQGVDDQDDGKTRSTNVPERSRSRINLVYKTIMLHADVADPEIFFDILMNHPLYAKIIEAETDARLKNLSDSVYLVTDKEAYDQIWGVLKNIYDWQGMVSGARSEGFKAGYEEGFRRCQHS